MRAVLIPMKELAQAKMRLADVLDGRQRSGLALAMLTDVISACITSGCFDEVAVIGNDSEVAWHVREMGAKPLAEPATLTGLNESLTFGQRYLARRVAVDELLILPADIPLIHADDVKSLVEALTAGDAPRVVLVRSRDNGTNALGLRPPEAIDMHFGRNSADAHRAAADALRIDIVEIENPRLAFDVDAPDDVTELTTASCGAATSAWVEARSAYAAENP